MYRRHGQIRQRTLTLPSCKSGFGYGQRVCRRRMPIGVFATNATHLLPHIVVRSVPSQVCHLVLEGIGPHKHLTLSHVNIQVSNADNDAVVTTIDSTKLNQDEFDAAVALAGTKDSQWTIRGRLCGAAAILLVEEHQLHDVIIELTVRVCKQTSAINSLAVIDSVTCEVNDLSYYSSADEYYMAKESKHALETQTHFQRKNIILHIFVSYMISTKNI